ncbi:MAG: dihydrodipicolinate synthase family protein [Bifidobacteriaceae bacterium]|nr:dihydrodipicolinate synthase family protein [Bifidobacteriaceae bacterium]
MASDFELIDAAFTPLHPDGSINPDGVTAYAGLMKRQGIDGAFVCGSTGEGPLLTTGERKALAERWVAEAGGEVKVVVHVGHSSPWEARGLAQHAAAIGADAISAVGPFYFRPDRLGSLVESCAIIASGAPDLPFYYYHAPAQTGVTIAMASFLVAATKRIPSFAGIKFTHEDLSDFADCLALAKPGQRIYFGRDEILVAALALGANGAIGTTYSLLAPVYRAAIAATSQGDLPGAQASQAIARRVVGIGLSYGGLPAFKLMNKWAGTDCGPVRAPLNNLTSDDERRLRAELEAADVLQYIASGG